MILGFDHFVVRCRDIEKSLAFYCEVLDLSTERLEEWRNGAVPFPSVRLAPSVVIDLLPADHDAEPADKSQRIDHVCLTTDKEGLQALQTKLADAGVPIEDGPDMRWGAQGEGLSIYFRDPNGLTIEVRTYDY
jgi:catechol 2,3-dioxygenase-like lactoylglutathione lyase family enzyme